MNTNDIEDANLNFIELREKLNTLDQVIIETLIARFEITDEIGTLKRELEKPIMDLKREEIILDRIRKISAASYCNPNGILIEQNLIEIYKEIMNQSKLRQVEIVNRMSK